jgi:HEXXH motif-containing protein
MPAAQPTLTEIERALSSPWGWRPSPAAYLKKISARARQWTPALSLGIDELSMREAVVRAAETGARWLLHPIVNPILLDSGQDGRTARDFQLAVWLAAHGALTPQQIEASEPLWVWAPGGSFHLEQGRHDLQRLGATVAASAAPGAISLDPWCHTLGCPVRGSWAQFGEALSQAQQQQMESELVLFLRAWAMLEHHLPDCADWVAAATSVVIPLYSDNTGQFHSSSAPDLPGLVQMDLAGGVMQILEAMVHETAHQHLYLAEAAAPLVDPADQGRYRSPLRSEPRPLHGILMAWHALAYITLLYREMIACGVLDTAEAAELSHLRGLLGDAEATIERCHDAFTPAGAEFCIRTRAVARRARS